MRGKCGGVEHEVRRTAAATAKLKITYMHHGGMVDVPDVLWDHKMQRDGEDGSEVALGVLVCGFGGANTITNLGEISHPCCMKAPRENHRLLKIPKSFGGSGGL